MATKMKKRRISEAEADLLAMKLRRENIVSQHKAAMEEFKFREMIKAGEKVRNYSNEFGSLSANHARLPPALQREIIPRLRFLAQELLKIKNKISIEFSE